MCEIVYKNNNDKLGYHWEFCTIYILYTLNMKMTLWSNKHAVTVVDFSKFVLYLYINFVSEVTLNCNAAMAKS